jgi:DNA segregation ATPase FtsK/SpoIIIE-like protein
MSFHLSPSAGLTAVEAADFGDLFHQAAELARREGRATVWMLQSAFGINTCRAARVVDALERTGQVPPEIRARPRAAALRPLST